MKHFFALLGLVSCLAVPAQARTVYYYTSQSVVAASPRPPNYYATNKVVPIVGLNLNLFTTGQDWESALAQVDAAIAGPFTVAVSLDNFARNNQPGGSTLCPWADQAGWNLILANLAGLKAACLAHGCTTVMCDGEIYTETPGDRGGGMTPEAWPVGGAERGIQFRQALAGLTVGQFLYVFDGNRHTGWKEFWKAAYLKGDLLLDEGGYVRPGENDGRSAFGPKVTNLPGRGILNGTFLLKVPAGSFWIYPYQGDAATDLAQYSMRW